MGIFVLVIALALAAADQFLKILAVQNLKGSGTVTVINKLLYLTYAENKGAAFSMLANKRWVFIVFTFAALAVLLFIVFKFNIKNKIFIASAALIIGGGIGNLIDRIRLGYVVDYIYWSFFRPVCNFADYCITAGTALLMLYIIFYSDVLKEKNTLKNEPLPASAETNNDSPAAEKAADTDINTSD